jgi:hypothetical protein
MRPHRSKRSRPGVRLGRPTIQYRSDEDRHAVALLEMMLHTSIGGKSPAVRRAASHAAFCKEGRLQASSTFTTPPPRDLNPTLTRKLPIPPALKGGYQQLDIAHVNRRPGGTALENCSLRLRRKRREWAKPNSEPMRWLGFMALAWAAALFPDTVRRELKREPLDVCRAAARAAGEHDFLEKVLLPHLNSQNNSGQK